MIDIKINEYTNNKNLKYKLKLIKSNESILENDELTGI